MIIMHDTDAVIAHPQRFSLDYIDRCAYDDARLMELIKSPLGEQVRAFTHEHHGTTQIELWSLDSKLRAQFTEKLRMLLN